MGREGERGGKGGGPKTKFCRGALNLKLRHCRKSIPQTNKHLLSNCSSLLERYTIRHNAILEKLAQWIDTHKSASQCLLVDLPSSRFSTLERVFQSSVRPDIVIQEDARVLVLELTACHESNLLKSKEYKENKYRNISTHLLPCLAQVPVLVFTVEVSVLGIVSNLKSSTQAANLPDIPQSLLSAISKSTIMNSFEIFRSRNVEPQSGSV